MVELRFLILVGNDTISHFEMIMLSQILEPRQLEAGF
jgi:hypothetical protein